MKINYYEVLFVLHTFCQKMNCELCRQKFNCNLHNNGILVKDEDNSDKVLFFCFDCLKLVDEYKVGKYSSGVLFKLEKANDIIQYYFNETKLKFPQGNCTKCLCPLYHECTSTDWQFVSFDIRNTCRTCILITEMTS